MEETTTKAALGEVVVSSYLFLISSSIALFIDWMTNDPQSAYGGGQHYSGGGQSYGGGGGGYGDQQSSGGSGGGRW